MIAMVCWECGVPIIVTAMTASDNTLGATGTCICGALYSIRVIETAQPLPKVEAKLKEHEVKKPQPPKVPMQFFTLDRITIPPMCRYCGEKQAMYQVVKGVMTSYSCDGCKRRMEQEAKAALLRDLAT